jgi:hypothetical protein
MPTIYLATPNNPDLLINNKKLKYVVVKENEVTILNNKQYEPDFSYILTFKIGKSNANSLKKHIKDNIENLNIDYPAKFLELLKDNFDFQEQQEFKPDNLRHQENHLQVASLAPDKEEEELLARISQSPTSTPKLLRPNSTYESTIKNPFLIKTLSFLDFPGENSLKISGPEISSDLSSSQYSIHSQDSLENEARAQLIDGAQKIRSFFTKKENLSHIENHALNIQNGYFNGEKKSKILLNITQLAGKIRDVSQNIGKESSNEQIQSLKQNVSEFDKMINNKQNLDTLSRYRGFSPFKCFATLWGGGEVKSIKYVEKLREQVGSLANDLAALRPSV